MMCQKTQQVHSVNVHLELPIFFRNSCSLLFLFRIEGNVAAFSAKKRREKPRMRNSNTEKVSLEQQTFLL
jgi:hypothetical protein